MSDAYLEILRSRPIPIEYWKELSAGAWSGRPHHETLLSFHTRQLSEAMAKQLDEIGDLDLKATVEVGGPDIPADIDAVDASLPPLSQVETMAVLIQFLRVERGDIAAGARIAVLHWLILCGVFAAHRERYTALRELVAIGRLKQADDAVLYQPSSLKWPLVLTAEGASDLEELLHVRRHIPTMWRLKTLLGAWLRAIPLLGDALRKKIPGG